MITCLCHADLNQYSSKYYIKERKRLLLTIPYGDGILTKEEAEIIAKASVEAINKQIPPEG